jgi:transcription antitermination factor NusG
VKWFVLYTKPHCEIKVANALENIGIRSYCPVFKQVKQYSDRKNIVEKPLLRSYVMVKIENKDRNRVFSVPGIVRYVFWLGKPAIVRESEIELMEKNLAGIYDEISITSTKKGANFTIPAGPFKGQQGKVINLFKNKIKLELSSLGIIVILKTA